VPRSLSGPPLRQEGQLDRSGWGSGIEMAEARRELITRSHSLTGVNFS
jgi:hypothetical protein